MGWGRSPTTPPAQLRCDAEVRYVRQTRISATLDAGRTRRDPTPRQRAAVIARDRTCIGCGAAAARCQIHHIRWHGHDGGPTDEPNLVLVCWNCHHHLHHHGWQVIGDHILGFAITRGPNHPTRPTRRRTP